MKRFADNYLRIAVIAGFGGSALWVLFILLGAGEAVTEAEVQVATALGVVICFIAPFLLVLFLSGIYAGWEDMQEQEGELQVDVLLTPHQRERFGFALMAASLLLLLGHATAGGGGVIMPIGSSVLMLGGIVLVVTGFGGGRQSDHPES